MLTRGRYYFAPPDAPWYDGFHNLWSADWTWDAGEKPEASSLGEDRYKRLGYSKGAFGTTLPLPRLLGDKPCLENGEAYPFPAGMQERPMIGGVDALCWGDLPPANMAALWLTPATFPDIPDTATANRWKDASPVTNDAVQSDRALQAGVDYGSVWAKSAVLTTSTRMIPKVPLRMKDNWAIYCAGWFTIFGVVQPQIYPFGYYGPNEYPLQITRLGMRLAAVHTIASWLIGNQVSQKNVWAVTCRDRVLTFWRNGVPRVVGELSAVDHVTVRWIQGYLLTPGVSGSVFFPEFAVFPWGQSVAEETAFLAYMAARYLT